MSPAFSSSRASSPSHSLFGSSPLRSLSSLKPHLTFSASTMEENVEVAEAIITKWDVEEGSGSYCRVDSLFSGGRREAKEFLKAVNNLQTVMQFLVTHDSSSKRLVQAQQLMQIAMKRLQKEFHQILSRNRDSMNPDSVSSRSSRASASSGNSDCEDDESEDDVQFARDSVTEVERVSQLAMSDLKSIADTMISCGYVKECVKIYKLLRKSIVDESLYNLGIEKLSLSQLQKMDWELIEIKIKSWLNAVKVAVMTLFHGERICCDTVFSALSGIVESCFAEICREGAMTLFQLPEFVAKYKKLSLEKLFSILDLYDAMSEIWPEIDSIFSFDSISAVRSQAVTCVVKLRDASRALLSDFDTAIQKESSKSAIPGGGVHPLTRYVMNYVVLLSDYSGTLSEIVADWPLQMQSPLPESYFSSPCSDDGSTSGISVRLVWLILVLLCKLDCKAELYDDVSLAYLFLANNLNYVVSKVRTSNLKLLLGDDWLERHEAKVKQYAANYERMGWSKVISSLPEINGMANMSPEEARECFRSFNRSFEEAYRKQTSWVVPDPKLRDEIKVSLAKKLGSAYRSFYEKYEARFRREIGAEPLVKYVPDDLENYLSDLFYGIGASPSLSLSLSSLSLPSMSSSSSSSSWWHSSQKSS